MIFINYFNSTIMSLKITAYDKLSFEDAVRILYYQFSEKPARLEEHLASLINRSERPTDAITRVWYDEYREFHKENQEGK